MVEGVSAAGSSLAAGVGAGVSTVGVGVGSTVGEGEGDSAGGMTVVDAAGSAEPAGAVDSLAEGPALAVSCRK